MSTPVDEPSQPGEQGNASTALDSSDRLIATLQLCFGDLARKQEEQADRLQKAVEALKPQALATDTKTTFWNSYMKLADEHDNEFRQKYGTDLDTALIFAGLFSAVSSAFIIQVQSGLPGPHSNKIITAEILLYISLFTTLLTALLAVLGKQWVTYYHTAGSKGTAEQRGLERQRKLDGLVRWKFDMVLQTFPLLLQLALLVFSAALSIYLWTVNILVASVVLAMTCSGFIGYILLLSTAIFYEDSPFQNPLASVLSSTFQLPFINNVINKLQLIFWHLWMVLQARFRRTHSQILPSVLPTVQPPPVNNMASDLWDPDAFTLPSPDAPAVLWVLETSTDPQMVKAAAEMALDLQWALNADVASAMVRLLETYKSCFQRISASRWDVDILPGLSSRAISCGKAYCVLGHIMQVSKTDSSHGHYSDTCGFGWFNYSDTDVELYDVFSVAASWVYNLKSKTPSTIRWASHVYPSSRQLMDTPEDKDDLEERLVDFLDQFSTAKNFEIDQATFANYLCSLNSCFQRLDPKVVVQLDKSCFQDAFLTLLLNTLTGAVSSINTRLIAKLVITTAHWKEKLNDPKHPNQSNTAALWDAALQFCQSFPRENGWLDAVVAVASLVRVNDENLYNIDTYPPPSPQLANPQDLEWIYSALDHVQQTWGSSNHLNSEKNHSIQGLLQILASTGDPPSRPPLSVIRVVLHALSSDEMSRFLAFVVLHHMKNWFTDPEVEQLVIHEAHAWPDLVKAVSWIDVGGWRYYEMVSVVMELPQWQPLIRAELPTWLHAYSPDWNKWYSPDTFVSVTHTIWAPTLPNGITTFTNKFEECWALALAALSQVWRDADFADYSGIKKWAHLAESTILTAFKTKNSFADKPFPSDLRDICCSQLGEAIAQASANTRQSISHYCEPESGPLHDPKQVLGHLADILDVLALNMKTHPLPEHGAVHLAGETRDYNTWDGLKILFLNEISAWKESIHDSSTPVLD